MKLNSKKTKNMIVNFSTNKQFITNIELDGEILETVDEHKLLGTSSHQTCRGRETHRI